MFTVTSEQRKREREERKLVMYRIGVVSYIGKLGVVVNIMFRVLGNTH